MPPRPLRYHELEHSMEMSGCTAPDHELTLLAHCHPRGHATATILRMDGVPILHVGCAECGREIVEIEVAAPSDASPPACCAGARLDVRYKRGSAVVTAHCSRCNKQLDAYAVVMVGAERDDVMMCCFGMDPPRDHGEPLYECAPRPVGDPCTHCDEPIAERDAGFILPFSGGPGDPDRVPYHRECLIAQLCGHLVEQCACFEPTLSLREAARRTVAELEKRGFARWIEP